MVPHARQPLARAPTFGNHLGLDDLARYYERYRPLPMSSIAAELEGMTSILINGEQALREGIRHLVEDHQYGGSRSLAGRRAISTRAFACGRTARC
jgi:hypothetical protein